MKLKKIYIMFMLMLSMQVIGQNIEDANNISLKSFDRACTPDLDTRIEQGDEIMADLPPVLFQPRPDTICEVCPDSIQRDSTRLVHWLHGLNGNRKSWNRPALYFQSFQDNSIIPRKIVSQWDIDYKDLQGLNLKDIAENVRSTIWSFKNQVHDKLADDYSRKRSILIGHSQGGIVARMMDLKQHEENQRTFGGWVSFCSSHQGAHIVNNKDLMLEHLDRLGKNLMEGPVSNMLIDVNKKLSQVVPSFFNALGVKDPKINMTAEQLTDSLSQYLLKDVFKYYIDVNLPKVTEDYKLGSPTITQLNNHRSNTRVATIGSQRPLITIKKHVKVKNELGKDVYIDLPVPISAATINYFINEPSSYEAFKAHEHEHEVAVALHNLRMHYIQQKNDQLFEAEIRYPIPGSGWQRYAESAESWMKGEMAIMNLDKEYRIAVGIAEYVEEQQGPRKHYCECEIPYNNHTMVHGPFDFPVFCDQYEFAEVTCKSTYKQPTVRKLVNYPSDGVVRTSQMDVPQRTYGIGPEKKMMIVGENYPDDPAGSTHMAIRNDENGKRLLINLFNGEYGDFFETKEK